MKLLFADATKDFTPDRKDKKACGGILTSLSIIPQYLAKKGHTVTVKSSYLKKEVINGVSYVPNKDKDNVPRWDVIVINRNGINNSIVDYSHKKGSQVVWWLHDIVDFRYLRDSSFKRVDKIIALSEYCRESFSEFYTIPLEKFVIIPNGVDKSVFYPGDYSKRTKYSMIMASALIKGFSPIYGVWINARRLFPSAKLTIYSTQALHGLENSQDQKDFLKRMEEEEAHVQPPIPQYILADKMRESWILLMPNSYPEMCSNLLLQARACGLPVITSNIGSASEFITHETNGILTKYAPHDLALWSMKYSEEVMKLMKNDSKHKQISDNAPKDIKSWEEIGEKWNEELCKLAKKT